MVILQERLRNEAEGFSRHFVAVIHMPDADDLRWEFGSNTEAVVYGVLQNNPNARTLFKTRNHFDYFEAEPLLERESGSHTERESSDEKIRSGRLLERGGVPWSLLGEQL